MRYVIISPWHKKEVKEEFMEEWELKSIPQWLLLEQDVDGIGCARMKNKLINKAFKMGAEVIGVIDSDCHPCCGAMNLQDWIEAHIKALEDQPVEMFEAITNPQSRGTPYYNRSVTMPVAASIGFWLGAPDWDAPSQLVRGDEEMTFTYQKTIFGKYFPFCGMNFAFKKEWIECARLIDVERMDDIWMGFIWQKIAYEKGYCFNLNGQMVYHSRQSNVWHNLKVEAEHLKTNETLWQKVHQAPRGLSYNSLKLYLGYE